MPSRQAQCGHPAFTLAQSPLTPPPWRACAWPLTQPPYRLLLPPPSQPWSGTHTIRMRGESRLHGGTCVRSLLLELDPMALLQLDKAHLVLLHGLARLGHRAVGVGQDGAGQVQAWECRGLKLQVWRSRGVEGTPIPVLVPCPHLAASPCNTSSRASRIPSAFACTAFQQVWHVPCRLLGPPCLNTGVACPLQAVGAPLSQYRCTIATDRPPQCWVPIPMRKCSDSIIVHMALERIMKIRCPPKA